MKDDRLLEESCEVKVQTHIDCYLLKAPVGDVHQFQCQSTLHRWEPSLRKWLSPCYTSKAQRKTKCPTMRWVLCYLLACSKYDMTNRISDDIRWLTDRISDDMIWQTGYLGANPWTGEWGLGHLAHPVRDAVQAVPYKVTIFTVTITIITSITSSITSITSITSIIITIYIIISPNQSEMRFRQNLIRWPAPRPVACHWI